jgi:hypothetical protein
MPKTTAKTKAIYRSTATGKILPAGSAATVKKLASNKKTASEFLQRAGIITKGGALTSKYK